MKTTNPRRYDLDWIRVIAIGMLLIYHNTISFQPWAGNFLFMQNSQTNEYLWIPMALLNVWRIPILFFLSGMGVYYAMRKRNWLQLIMERSRRILLPLVVGYFAVVPLHMFVLQYYNQQAASYSPGFGHLWFLANIFGYVVLLSPLFYLMRRYGELWLSEVAKRLHNNRWGIYLFILPFVAEVLLLQPEIFCVYLFTSHGFVLGLLAFFLGYSFVAMGESFWEAVARLKYYNLALALSFYLVRLLVFRIVDSPLYLTAIESVLWIFTIFGISYSYLNRKSSTIGYLSKAAYPIYIIHMAFQYLASYYIFPLEMHWSIQYPLVIVFTFVGSSIFYEFVINRNRFVRPFFGLNYRENSK